MERTGPVPHRSSQESVCPIERRLSRSTTREDIQRRYTRGERAQRSGRLLRSCLRARTREYLEHNGAENVDRIVAKASIEGKTVSYGFEGCLVDIRFPE